MKVLAIDTATEQCSVALGVEDQFIERRIATARGHAELVLPMVDEVLREAGLELRELDALAFGRGPGAFTGVRIAAGVIQGLALGSGVPVVPVSDLAALALHPTVVGDHALVAIDARMGEVYWAIYARIAADALAVIRPERVTRPEAVAGGSTVQVCAGSGVRTYPEIALQCAGARAYPDALPDARAIAILGAAGARRGEARPAAEALPVYLRNDVVRRP